MPGKALVFRQRDAAVFPRLKVCLKKANSVGEKGENMICLS